jgi:hypothetical protein
MSAWTAHFESTTPLGTQCITGSATGEYTFVLESVDTIAGCLQEGDTLNVTIKRELSADHPLVGVDLEQANRAALDAMMGYAGTRETDEGHPLP